MFRKSNPHGSDPAGVCESCMRQGRPGERWRLGDVCDDCAYDYDQIRYGSAAEKAAAKKALKARAAHAMRKNPMTKRRKNPGKVLATTVDDRELLMGALECAVYEIVNRRRRGETISKAEDAYQTRLEEMYNRIADL